MFDHKVLALFVGGIVFAFLAAAGYSAYQSYTYHECVTAALPTCVGSVPCIQAIKDVCH